MLEYRPVGGAEVAPGKGPPQQRFVLTGNGGVILGSPGLGFPGSAKLGEVTQLQCITIIDLPMHRERAEIAGAEVSETSRRAGLAHSYTVDDPEAPAGTSAKRYSQRQISHGFLTD